MVNEHVITSSSNVISIDLSNVKIKIELGENKGGIDVIKEDGNQALWSNIKFSQEGMLFNTDRSKYISMCALSDDKAILAYNDEGKDRGYVRMIKVSENKIGSKVRLTKGPVRPLAICALSPDKCLVAYCDINNKWYGTVQLLSCTSDEKIISSSSAIFNDRIASDSISLCALSEDRALLLYRDPVSMNGIIQPITITGDGSKIMLEKYSVFDYAANISICKIAKKKFLLVYTDEENKGCGCARVILLTNAGVVIGDPVVFDMNRVFHISACYLGNNRALVAYQDYCNGEYGKVNVLNVSDLDIEVGGKPEYFNVWRTEFISVCALTENKAIVTYRKEGECYDHQYTKKCGAARVISILDDNTLDLGQPIVFCDQDTYPGYHSNTSTIFVNGKVLVGSSVFDGNKWNSYIHTLWQD